jgi:LPXTG-site transpeptidase (sortase) family protein
LKGVRIGDIVDIVTPSGTYHYKVESTKIVMPKNVEVLDPTPDPSLTLVTCYPFNYVGSAPKRFIVRARQIGGPEVAGSSGTNSSTKTTKNRATRNSRSRPGA